MNRADENAKDKKEIQLPDEEVDRKPLDRSSIFIAILTVIIAALGIIGKWLLIQPIHDEIADKYKKNQSLYFEQGSFCEKTFTEEFNIITFSVACFLILLLIVCTKRTSKLLPNLFYGYGGVPMPIDFFSHEDRIFAGFIFAVSADDLFEIISSVINGTATQGEGVLVNYLLRVGEVLIIGIRYYALLSAVYLNTLLILICATIYAWLDYIINILTMGMCTPSFYPTYEDSLSNSTQIQTLFDYYGTGRNLIAAQLCADIPRFICSAYVIVKLLFLLGKKIYLKFKANLTIEQRFLMGLTPEQRNLFHISRPGSVEMIYVRNLFRPASKRPKSKAILARIIPKKIYEWRDDYKFSARIICLYTSVFLLLYQVIIESCIQLTPTISTLAKSIQSLANTISSIFFPSSSDSDSTSVDSNTSNFPIPHVVNDFLAAIFITLFVIVIQLLLFLIHVRRNSMQAYRGDVTDIPRRDKSEYISYATGNFHFAGYFIGYLIWGIILIAVFAFLLCLALDGFITYGSVPFVEKILKFIIPSLLFVLFKLYLNKVLARYFFLQHFGEVLSLDNRRSLMIFIYFNFYLDAFLGFISSVVRLVKSLIGGILYMCRLDYSPLGRKLETMDGGFSAYCGFIHTECTHRHPILLVCVAHLYTRVKKRELIMEMKRSGKFTGDENYEVQRKPDSRYRHKWKLAVFLIRNPALVFFRKAYLNQLNIDDVQRINDIHSDAYDTLTKRKLSVNTRRVSPIAPTIDRAESSSKLVIETRF